MGIQHHQYRNKLSTARCRGFSLVEIMISIVISIVLMTGIIQIFLSNKQTYRTTEAMSRMQENTRYAMHVLTKDIRMAGLMPCPDTGKTLNILNDTASWQFNFDNAVTGYEGGVDAFPAEFTNATDNITPVAGTDAITIVGASGDEYKIVTHNKNAASIKLADSDHDIDDGDILFVCDNESSAIFQITSASPGTNDTLVHNKGNDDPGNCSKGLGYANPRDCSTNGTQKSFATPESKLVKFKAVAYYIATSDTCSTRCLYRIEIGDNGGVSGFDAPAQLVEGVENMQILYGADTTGDGAADLYDTADNIADWTEVVSVRLGLLMHTLEEVANAGDTDTTTYNVVDTSIGGTSGATTIQHDEDRRLRFVAPTTIKLRNKGCSGTNGC